MNTKPICTYIADLKLPCAVDCYACTSIGQCLILIDTDFKGKECPFYKSQADYEAGILKYGGLKK